MFDEVFKTFGFGGNCGEHKKCTTSCDVLWIIVLLMIVLKGGMLGLDLCTLIILFIVFGGDLLKVFTPKAPCGC
jgi:hypothetical protein